MDPNPFDEKAATWDDDPAKIERARMVAEQIVGAVPVEATWTMLEYGAGTGLVSERLQHHLGHLTLVDTSAGMRAAIAAKVRDGRLPSGTQILDLDLSAGPVPDDRFDLIVTVLALHHVPLIERTLAAFATLLRPGGYVCVVDLDAEDGSFHNDASIPHHGFERQTLARLLEASGFGEVRIADCGELTREGRPFQLFLATARRVNAADVGQP